VRGEVMLQVDNENIKMFVILNMTVITDRGYYNIYGRQIL